ncbi:hypothetical protein CC78DRAFT_538073 [Lojkania enalia]|uniref:Autophagy protein n=1 Tax=Lojkania enalia TaxID=147567 RepID=A0A9P4JWU1_9PLEO|nr:hypothetical protein CC78DRAFT_538073 [Didymosphaeria enalia]
MGWLWGSGESSAKDTLDPSLRDFLEKESPSDRSKGQKPSLPSKLTSKPVKPPSTTPFTPEESSENPLVPKESLFQDGRYAYLWKNYEPQHIIEDRGKNDQDRLRDVVDAYNDRRGGVGRIALENCTFEYLEQWACFSKPNWYQTATMCRAESKRFNRCYEIQTKFLKALGYLTIEPRSPKEDEMIQMHADKLYQQMLEQEKLIEQAKAEGRPIPKFESVLSKRNIDETRGDKPAVIRLAPEKEVAEDEDDVWSKIKDDVREQYEKKLAEMKPGEQEFERKALLGELRGRQGVSKKLEEAFIEERINRMKRKEEGRSTLGDYIKHAWGWK